VGQVAAAYNLTSTGARSRSRHFLENLKMVGVLQQNRVTHALVKTPTTTSIGAGRQLHGTELGAS
jgi:Tfp pilus assembly protein PilP